MMLVTEQMLYYQTVICLLIGFFIGIVADRLGRLVRLKYGWFTK
jgi:hypothetical protein